MKKRTFFECGLILLLAACSPAGFAQTLPADLPAKIDTLLTAYAQQSAFSGTVLVARQGAILFEKGYGYRNKGAKLLNDANTIFQIGSITKQFTSAMILQLQEKHLLSVQDKLSKYIPDYPRGDEITIEELLTHTSGVYNYTNDAGVMTKAAFQPIARDSLIGLFKYKPLDFTPGSKYSYSNSGYILLGYIIGKVTGKPYFQVVRERVFAPLGMEHSGFDFRGLVSTDKAVGYAPPGGVIPAPVVDSSVSFAAGAIYTTAGDLYKWDRALYAGRVLSQASEEAAFTPHIDKYGYGWMIDSLYGNKIVEHGGGIPGFVSFILRSLGDETCIIVLDNAPSVAQPGKIAADIYALLNGRRTSGGSSDH